MMKLSPAQRITSAAGTKHPSPIFFRKIILYDLSQEPMSLEQYLAKRQMFPGFSPLAVQAVKDTWADLLIEGIIKPDVDKDRVPSPTENE